MWTPSDLLTDLDLLALDRLCLTDFGVSALTDKRRAAVDWLAPRVEQSGYKLWQHRVRRAPEAVFGYTGAAFVDYTDAAKDTTEGDLALATIFAAPAGDALYVGSRDPFKGVYLGLLDTINSNTCTLAVSVWSGAWTAVTSLADGTRIGTGKSLSGGGLVAWQHPDSWSRRSVNNSLLYWAKLTVSSSLTAGTVAAQVAPVVASRLTLPASYYALGLLYQESYGSNRGAWQEKAGTFFDKAANALDVALPLIADEFDVNNDDQVDRTEISSVQPDIGYLTTWERG